MSGWIVKRDGPCFRCGTTLRAGEPAVWNRGTNRMSCIECPAEAAQEPSPAPIDLGTAGRSTRDRYDRLMAKRETELEGRWGKRVGGWINRFAAEPQSIAAWGIGAKGEELPDWRLTVNRRDKSKLARDMGWQVEAVTAALTAAAVDPLPAVTPVLCFIDGRWPIFGAPDVFEGVLLESERSLVKRLIEPVRLDPVTIESIAQAIATGLPPK